MENNNSTALAMLAEAGLPENIDDLFTALAAVTGDQDAPSTGDVKYLGMRQEDGVFTFGANDEGELDPLDQYLVQLRGAEHGWFAWHNGQSKKVFVPLAAPKPAKPEALGINESGPQKGHEAVWGYTYGLDLMVLTGDHAGMTLRYEGTNAGSSGALKKILEEIKKQCGRGGLYLFPVVTLTGSEKTGSYKKRFPRIEFIDWRNPAGESRLKAGAVGVTVEADEVVDVTIEEPVEAPSAPAGGKRRRLE